MRNSDFLLGHFHENASICVEMKGGCEKSGNVSVHAFPKINVVGVLLFLFTSDRLGLKFPS